MGDRSKIYSHFQDYRDRASISGRILNQSLVLFSQTVQHIARAARVFRQREGHMLLVGIGGSGKSSVAELAAYIELCSFIKPSLKRNYSHADFREDLKDGYLKAGIEGQKTVLYLSDSHIVKVRVLLKFLSKPSYSNDASFRCQRHILSTVV